VEADLFWWPSEGHRKSKDHATNLGKLWTQLHSLETAIRILLCQVNGVPDLQRRLHAILIAPVGTRVPDDPFTGQHEFKKLINLFNELAQAHGVEAIEGDIGELRSALAHGRVCAVTENDAIHLVNFKRTKGGAPVISYSAVLTYQWVTHQHQKIQAAIARVHAVAKTLDLT
jgi:hypothetical protein